MHFDSAETSAEIFKLLFYSDRLFARRFFLRVHDIICLVDNSTMRAMDQYSSGSKNVVTDLSHSVMTQSFSPFDV